MSLIYNKVFVVAEFLTTAPNLEIPKKNCLQWVQLTDFGFLQYTLLLIIFVYIWDHMYIWLVNRNLLYRGCGEIGVSDSMCVRLRVSCV